MNIHKNVSKIYASSGVNLDNSEKVKDQIKTIGNHLIEINPYINISKEFTVTVNKN